MRIICVIILNGNVGVLQFSDGFYVLPKDLAEVVISMSASLMGVLAFFLMYLRARMTTSR